MGNDYNDVRNLNDAERIEIVNTYCKSSNRKMLTKEQWKQALEELSECPLFSGHYDAENGSSDYMDGIGNIIEWMAYKAEDDSVYDAFLNNRILSEDKTRS